MTFLKQENLLNKLLVRGVIVYIERGGLIIEPCSKKAVPETWLKDNRQQLISEIVKMTGVDVLIYKSYSTGRYGDKKSGGVTLQFYNLKNNTTRYTTFNACLVRKRTTHKGKAGSPLPRKQFSVSDRYMFYQFWVTSGLPLPKRLSTFHDYMGNLKKVLFSGEVSRGERLLKDTIRPVSISYKEIVSAYNTHTETRQQPYTAQTISPDKEVLESPVEYGNEVVSATGDFCCGTSKHGDANKRGNVTPVAPVNPRLQSIDEWKSDYESTD